MSGPSACGCHIYAGGFTTGVRDSFDVVGQWEEITAGARTFELNYPDVPHPTSLEDWPIDQFRDRLELFFGNPPCAPWSTTGSRLGLRDPRMQYTANVMNAALELNPEFYILESVPRAWSPNGGRQYYSDWAAQFIRRGYAVTVVLTNGLLHGLPQSRERFHFIAHRMRLPLEDPLIDPLSVGTVGSALAGLPELGDLEFNHTADSVSPGNLNVIRRLAQGEGWGTGYERCVADGVEGKKSRFIAGRLNLGAPAPTVLDIGVLVHPTEDRMLTTREGARLCSYPDWFRFYPGAGNSEVTQAVLPAVGRFWGKIFTRALDRADGVTSEDREQVNVADWRPLGKPFIPRRYEETMRELGYVGAAATP